MGRKKGKQSGGHGSKRQRAQADRTRFAEAQEDLALPRATRPSVRNKRLPAPPPQLEPRPPAEEKTAPTLEVGSTLVAACAATIGRHLDRFVADDETCQVFGLLPALAIEVISSTCWATRRNVGLLGSNPDVRRLKVVGDVGDDDLAAAIFPKRRNYPPGSDEWVVRDVTLGIRGCVSLRELTLDAPVSWRFFYELCRALPDIERLRLGDKCPSAAVDVVLENLRHLTVLDVSEATWFDVGDFGHGPTCSHDPPVMAPAPCDVLCRGDVSGSQKRLHPRRGMVTLIVEAVPRPVQAAPPPCCSVREAIFGSGRPRDEFVRNRRDALQVR